MSGGIVSGERKLMHGGGGAHAVRDSKITSLHPYQLAQDGSSHTQHRVGNNLLQSIYKNMSFFFLDQVVKL